ncbi:MAG: hypothetical protein CSA03_02610 [Bacteroidetes bacterium]|nr:MAG: hypothetical protein CSA03_02610 [Bacteroidota bacterium]
MKTAKTILVTLLALTPLFGNSQNSDYSYNKQPTYIDALRLNQLLNENVSADSTESVQLKEEYYSILSRYGIDSISILSHPFLGDLEFVVNTGPDANLLTVVPGPDRTKSSGEENIAQSESVPMNWEAAAINGIANFMAGRFKQEVLHMSIDQMFNRISLRDSTLVSELFPKTFAHIVELQKDGNDAYYTADLLYLRELVHLDMEALPTTITKNLDKIFPTLDLKPEMIDGFTLSAGLVKYASMGVPVDQLLNFVSDTSLYSSDSSVVCRVVNITDLLSQAYKDKAGTGRTWVNPVVTLPHMGNPNSTRISKLFYGLLYSQLSEIKEFKMAFEKVTKSTDLVEANNRISKMIQDFSLVVGKLEMIGNVLKENNYEVENLRQAMGILDELVDVVDMAANGLGEIDINLTKVDSAMQLAHEYISFTESIMDQDYRSAIPKLVAVLSSYSKDNIEISRALGFLSGLGEVENDADMEKLLQAYALPIGSASIKRSSTFNLSVNGYVGITGGLERAFALESSNNQDKGNFGLTAPIGISMTFANGHITLFASVFDLGSIVNQRLNNDTTSYVDLRFEQFFSPGAQLYWNFKNTPLSLGAGVSYVPNLRTIKYNDGTATVGESGLNVLRINASLVIDIPFFTLYNRTIPSDWEKEHLRKKNKGKHD